MGFSTGILRIMEALSFFPFCFFFDATGLVLFASVGEPKPNPDPELGFLDGGATSNDEDEVVVAFWGSEELELEEDSWDLTERFLGLT